MAATRRVTKEYRDLQEDTPHGVNVAPDESNLLHWTGTLAGPDDSPYKGGKFKIDITFPLEYPFKAPTIKFMTKIIHMNITEEGLLCIGLLKPDAWKPSTKIDTVLRSLVQLLAEPAPEDALVASLAELYQSDKKAYEKQAQVATKRYAM